MFLTVCWYGVYTIQNGIIVFLKQRWYFHKDRAKIQTQDDRANWMPFVSSTKVIAGLSVQIKDSQVILCTQEPGAYCLEKATDLLTHGFTDIRHSFISSSQGQHSAAAQAATGVSVSPEESEKLSSIKSFNPDTDAYLDLMLSPSSGWLLAILGIPCFIDT